MVDAPDDRDMRAPERELIVADVVAAVQAEMAALKGEILRVMQAECRSSNQLLAQAVDMLASSCANLCPSAAAKSQSMFVNHQPGGNEDSNIGEKDNVPARPQPFPSESSPTQASSTAMDVFPPGLSASLGKRNTRRSVHDMVQTQPEMDTMATSGRPSQRGQALLPSHFAIQLAGARRRTNGKVGTSGTGSTSCALFSVSVSMRDMEPRRDETNWTKLKIAWNPESASRTVYESFSMLLLLFDAVTLPYTLAWSVPEEGFWMVAVWCTRLFWSMDLILSFFTGYQTKDFKIVRHLSLTSKHFLRTWFLCDAALVVWDWYGSRVPGLRLMRLARFARLIRQSQRMYVLLQKVKAMFYIKAAHLAIDISILLLMLMWFAHMLCCLWYVIGRHEEGSDTEVTWLSSGDYSKVGPSYEYLSVYEFRVQDFTGGLHEPEYRKSNAHAGLQTEGEFCTEVALWFDWRHLGAMTATAPTEVAVLDVSDCDASFLRRHNSAESVLRSYAVAFQHAMKDPHAYPSDLVHDIDYNDLMFALPLDSRMALSRPLFDQVGCDDARIKSPSLSKTQVARLEAGVAEGKNIVGIAGDEMVRFTFVVAIRVCLMDPLVGIPLLESGEGVPDDASFIVRLGELDVASNVVKASVMLPGATRLSHETPMATATRIIEREVKALIPNVDTASKHGRSRELFIKESPTYGVRTCYSRTCFVGFTDDSLEHFRIPGASRDFNPELPKETPSCMEWVPKATHITAQDVEMHEQAAHILQHKEIFWGVRDGNMAYLYAWLDQDEFDILSDERSKVVLDQYLDHLSKLDLALSSHLL